MSPAILAKPRPTATAPVQGSATALNAVPVHCAASPCTAPGRVTGKPGEVTCAACITWQVEQAWTIRHTPAAVTR